jgi:RHS repeat-associated protein
VYTKLYHANFGRMRRLIAVRTTGPQGQLTYVGTDHLGGTIRVTHTSFVALDQERYTPFGVSRDQAPNLATITDHKFTGQTEDAVIGLQWFASRAYDASLGRFVAADAATSHLTGSRSAPVEHWTRQTRLGRHATR